MDHRVAGVLLAAGEGTRLGTPRGIPAGPPQDVAGTGFDFRAARQVGTVTLDHAFTGLDRDEPGRAWARLTSNGAGAELAVAAYHGRARNPVLLARRHWAGVIAAADGDTGARPYLRAHPGLVTLVECADVGAPDDVDTPEDLARVAAALARRPVSPGA